MSSRVSWWATCGHVIQMTHCPMYIFGTLIWAASWITFKLRIISMKLICKHTCVQQSFIIQLSCYTLSSRHNTEYWNSKTAEEGKTQVWIKNRIYAGSMISLLSALSGWWAWPNRGINWEAAKSYQKVLILKLKLLQQNMKGLWLFAPTTATYKFNEMPAIC